jgi:hypothetical protein
MGAGMTDAQIPTMLDHVPDQMLADVLIDRGALVKWTRVPQIYRLITQCPSMEQGTPLTCELPRGHGGPHSYDTDGGGDG